MVRKETCYYALEAELHLTLCAPDSFSGLQCFSLLQEELLPKMLALPCVFTGYTTQHPQTDAVAAHAADSCFYAARCLGI